MSVASDHKMLNVYACGCVRPSQRMRAGEVRAALITAMGMLPVHNHEAEVFPCPLALFGDEVHVVQGSDH